MQMRRNVKKKLVASLIVFMMLVSNFATLGTSLVSLAADDSSEAVTYAVQFVKIENSEETEAVEEEARTEEVLEVTEPTEEIEEPVENEELLTTEAEENTEVSGITLGDADVEETTEEDLLVETEGEEPEEESTTEPTVQEPEIVVEPVNEPTEVYEGYAIEIKVGVKESGYLKNAKVEIKDLANQLFTLRNDVELGEYIQSIDENKIKLKQINGGTEVTMLVPISLKNEESIDIERLQAGTTINFTCTYVTSEGIEEVITKSETPKLQLNNSTEFGVDSTFEKMIPYNKEGVTYGLAQIKVRAGSVTTVNLPVKDTTVELELPVIDGAEITNVNVAAISTAYTNGLANSDVQFTLENWKYENGVVTISVNNNPADGRYYISNGLDEYIVTFTYVNYPEGSPGIVNANIKARSNVFDSEGSKELSVETSNEYDLSQANSNIITYEVAGNTQSFSKGYLYGNLNTENPEYSVEFDNNLNVNISRVELLKLVEIREADEYFEDTNGNRYGTTTANGVNSYYKSVKLNKANLDAILGENGVFELLNENGDQLIELSKATPDEGNGFITVSFGDSRIDKVLFRIINPEGDGILSITATKAIDKTTYNELDLMNFTSLNSEFVAAAALDGDIITDMGSTNVKIELLDTITDASVSVNRKDLSTLVANDNVEITINLNNASEISDVYTNPVFELTLPKEVTEVEVTDMNLLYGNGELSISNVESLYNEEGAQVIRVSLAGTQTKFVSSEANMGTTIILNTNMKVNMYQASVDSELKLTYYNEDATNYAYDTDWTMIADVAETALLPRNGLSSTELNIKAPEGLVNAQRISGYNEDRTVISVKQGFKEDSLEPFTEMKTAEMKMISINNTGETLSDVRILGRTMFEGNTSIVGNFPLGTNKNAPLTSEIAPDAGNTFSTTVYYSEKGDATESLEDENNGWTTTPEDLRKVKSFLLQVDGVVPNGSILTYKYNFEIPAELSNGVDMAATFAAFYTGEKNSGLDEADKIMLTTGEAPLFDIQTVSDTDVNAAVGGQHIRFTVKVTNKGNSIAKNVEINSLIPQGTTYVENGELRSDVTELNFLIEEIRPGQTEERSYEVEVNSSVPAQTYIEPASNVEADGMEEPVYTTIETKMPIRKPMAKIRLSSVEANEICKPGDKITYTTVVTNETGDELRNVVVVQDIPDNVEVVKAYVEEFAENGVDVYEGAQGEVNYDNHTITFRINEVKFFKGCRVELKVNDFNEFNKDLVSSSRLYGGTLDTEYKSNEIKIFGAKAQLEVSSYSSIENKFIKEGERIQYVLSINNVGNSEATNINVQNVIPDEYSVTDFSAIVGNTKIAGLANNRLNMNLSIPAGQRADIIAFCTVKNLENNVDEKITGNNWVVTGANINNFQTAQYQNIVVQNEAIADNPEYTTEYTILKEDEDISSIDTKTRSDVTLNEKEEIKEVKTYKIIGKAFNDLNKNGQRDEDEEGMENIVAKLCNAKNQKVIAQTITNKAGEYVFADVAEGDYYVKFEYDNEKYTVTSYKKEGVTSDKNSDAIISNYKAVTDKITVKGNSVSDIDIGLYKAGIFDLSVDANINQITVQNPEETTTLNMENPKLAKYDVKPQFTDNTSIFVEYTIDITNKGEIAGYVKQLVDYLPDGFTLDSSYNGGWYVGSDGNAYYNDLGETEIKPGETQTVKLILTKQMTEDGTGIFNNVVEINKDYNEYAIEDIDSEPGNNSQGEDDMSRADIIIGVQTGGSVVNVMIISTTLITLLVALYAIKVYVDKKNKEVIV